jgi:hypothetical protein
MCTVDTERRPLQTRRRASSHPVAVCALDGLEAVRAERWNSLLAPGQGSLSHGYLSSWARMELVGLRERRWWRERPTIPALAAEPGSV